MEDLQTNNPHDGATVPEVSRALSGYRKDARSSILDRVRNDEFTEIPSEFLFSKTSQRSPGDEGRLAHRSELHEAMRNEKYEQCIAQNQELRRPSRYHVPVNRPLPSRDWDNIQGKKYEETKVESSLAPLFSRLTDNNDGEGARLSFLMPQPERRQAIEDRKRIQHVRPDPEIRRLYNEPKNLPNLNKKVPKEFVPQCAFTRRFDVKAQMVSDEK